MNFVRFELHGEFVFLSAAGGREYRLDVFPARLIAALAVEFGPTFGLHGNAARDGGSAFGGFAFCAFGAARSFARAAVGGGLFAHGLRRSEDWGHGVIIRAEIFKAAAVCVDFCFRCFPVAFNGRHFCGALNDKQLKNTFKVANAAGKICRGWFDFFVGFHFFCFG
jgi:hypothetical protein